MQLVERFAQTASAIHIKFQYYKYFFIKFIDTYHMFTYFCQINRQNILRSINLGLFYEK